MLSLSISSFSKMSSNAKKIIHKSIMLIKLQIESERAYLKETCDAKEHQRVLNLNSSIAQLAWQQIWRACHWLSYNLHLKTLCWRKPQNM